MIVLNDPATATNSNTPTMPKVMSEEVRSVRLPKRARFLTAILSMLSMDCPRFRQGLVNLAVLKHECDFGLAHDLGIVGREHERRAKLVTHFLHQFDDTVRGIVVEIGGGFVGQYQICVGCQRAGNRHALLLSPRYLIRPFVLLAQHADRVEQPHDLLAPFILGPILHHDERVLDVLVNSENRYQVEILKDEADVLAAKLRSRVPIERTDVGIDDRQFSTGRMIETTDHVEQTALAAAGGADESDKGLRFNREIDALDREHVHFAGAISLNEMFSTN